MPGIGPGNLPPRPPLRTPPAKPEVPPPLSASTYGIIGGDYGEDNQPLAPKQPLPVTDLPPLNPIFLKNAIKWRELKPEERAKGTEEDRIKYYKNRYRDVKPIITPPESKPTGDY